MNDVTQVTAPDSVALDRYRAVWVLRRYRWECVTDTDDEADWAYPDELLEHFGPITVIYDAGAELL